MRGLRQAVSEPRRKVVRQPYHHAVVTEVLHAAEDDHAETDACGLRIGDQQPQRLRPFLRPHHLLQEQVRLLQVAPDEERGDGREQADREHAAPTDQRQQQRCHECRRQHAELPAEPDIGGGTRAFRGWPGLADQRHADAEFAAKAKPRDGAVGQQVPIALRQRAKAGEHREQQDGPGEDPHPAQPVGQHAEQHAAADGADQGRGDQRGGLWRRQPQLGRYGAQHEPQDQQVEAVHGIADRAADQCPAGLRRDRLDCGGRRWCEGRDGCGRHVSLLMLRRKAGALCRRGGASASCAIEQNG